MSAPSACFRSAALALLLLGTPAAAQTASFAFERTPLAEALATITERTGVAFLYRDAAVAGVHLTLRTPGSDLWPALERALAAHGLRLLLDLPRRQALIVPLPRAPTPPAAPRPALHGVVRDAATGERLPRATLTWTERGTLRGTVTDEQGAFRLVPDPEGPDTLTLTARHVGYAPRTVTLVRSAWPTTLTLRLRPEPLRAPAVHVASTALSTHLDPAWHGLVAPALGSSLGEPRVLRALQALPAVAITGAAGGNLHVRGARADGFQVLLDDLPVYPQSHLGGLFDPFVEEALRPVALYVGVPPATLPGAPGGTLAFATRSGARDRPRAHAGASTVAGRAVLEGPLAGGRGAWLVAGRHSWLGTEGLGHGPLLTHGLGTEGVLALPDSIVRLDARTYRPGTPSARFFDLHARLQTEAERGVRWTATAYLGGNDALRPGERCLLERPLAARCTFRPVATRAHGTTALLALQHHRPLGRALAHARLGLSRYDASFAQDDYPYVRTETAPTRLVLVAHRPLTFANALTDLSAAFRLDAPLPGTGTAAAGLELRALDVRYAETSALRVPFDAAHRAVQADAFVQTDLRLGALEAHLGLRLHAFAETQGGRFPRASPRLTLRLAPEGPVAASAGYGRTFQFLHRLTVEGAVHPDVWVPSTAGAPPTSADQLTAGLHLAPTRTTAAQLEVYRKTYRHLRQHETTAERLTLADGGLRAPWATDVAGRAQGLEMLFRQRIGPAETTLAYTLARVTLQSPSLHGGAPFPAPWDRRYQLASGLRLDLPAGLRADATALYGSGIPNPLAGSPGEADRLAAYHRLDLGIAARTTLGPATLEARAALFNAYDRANPTTRTPVRVLAEPPRPGRPAPLAATLLPADVTDLGRHLSFGLTVTF